MIRPASNERERKHDRRQHLCGATANDSAQQRALFGMNERIGPRNRPGHATKRDDNRRAPVRKRAGRKSGAIDSNSKPILRPIKEKHRHKIMAEIYFVFAFVAASPLQLYSVRRFFAFFFSFFGGFSVLVHRGPPNTPHSKKPRTRNRSLDQRKCLSTTIISTVLPWIFSSYLRSRVYFICAYIVR